MYRQVQFVTQVTARRPFQRSPARAYCRSGIGGPREHWRLHSLTETATWIVEVPRTLFALPNTPMLKKSSP